jgi:hypothetical protein
MAIKITRKVGRPTIAGKAIEIWLDSVGTWLQNWQRSSGHYTSAGDSSINQYEVIIGKNPTKGELIVGNSLGWALFGRKGSQKYPPWTPEEGFKEIKEWIVRKPIAIGADEDIDSVAFLIARKIKMKGSSPPKLRPQNVTIVINNFGKKAMPKLADEMAAEVADATVRSIDTRQR